MAYTLVNANTMTSVASGSAITPACTSTTAGNLLVLGVANASNLTISLPAGWSQAVKYPTSAIAIWYYPNCPAGITSVIVSLSSSTANPIAAQILEFNDAGGANPSPLDVTGSVIGSASQASPFAISASAATTAANELAVVFFEGNYSAATKDTFGAGAGFTQQGQVGNGVKQTIHNSMDAKLDTGASGVTVTDSVTFTGPLVGPLGVIATFKTLTVAPASPIAWRAGLTGDSNNAVQASLAVTIPAAVAAGDVVFVEFTGWGLATTETVQVSSTGTAPTILGTTQNVLFSGLYINAAVFRFVASATDAGKVITASLVSGHTTKWTAALGAYSGANGATPVDVSNVTTSATASITLPSVVTGVAGDWCLQVLGVSLQGSVYTGGSGFTQRESVVNASSGGGSALWDGNAAAGAAGSTIGGAVFSNAGGNSQWAGWTIGLAPAASTLPQQERQRVPLRALPAPRHLAAYRS